MQYVKWAAKAITAAVTVIIAASAAGTLDLAPWVEVVLTSALAAIAVFLVPNGSLDS